MYEYYDRGVVDDTTQLRCDWELYINASRVYG